MSNILCYDTKDIPNDIKSQYDKFIYIGGDDPNNISIYPWENFLIWHEENKFIDCKLYTLNSERYKNYVNSDRFITSS